MVAWFQNYTPKLCCTTLLEPHKLLPLTTGTEIRELLFYFSFQEGCRLPSQKFNVGLIQMSTTSDPDKNLQRAIDKVHQASARGAEIVCLPELFQTQYFCQRQDANLFDLAQPIPSPVTNRLATLAKQLRIVLIASLFEKRAPGLYHNTAVIFDADGSLRGLYRKMHIPDDPLYYEKYLLHPRRPGLSRFRHRRSAAWARWCAGTSGIPKAPA